MSITQRKKILASILRRKLMSYIKNWFCMQDSCIMLGGVINLLLCLGIKYRMSGYQVDKEQIMTINCDVLR